MTTIIIQYSTLPRTTNFPILTYCRTLLKQGYSPETKLKVYRGKQLGVRVNEIGKAAKLSIKETKDEGPKFVLHREFKKLSDILQV